MATYVSNRVNVRFETLAMGSIVMEPGGRGGFTSYRASDGVNLSFSRLYFLSTEDATRAFKNVRGACSKIVSREFVRNREGQFVCDERVVAVCPADDGREWPIMVCLDGTKLYEMSSTSLRHILIFEKERLRY